MRIGNCHIIANYHQCFNRFNILLIESLKSAEDPCLSNDSRELIKCQSSQPRIFTVRSMFVAPGMQTLFFFIAKRLVPSHR